ncbi:MAG: glutamine--fructose-6-phosphate transaminase (isomerizing), partial [Verrucomicrobia bacterium]|nr:glutamine--fructose-6-phosphate transaminase (isomerizing) [Verrucomicrobiota bacterium]
MCGIVGYIGTASAPPILLDGLRRLEYRGYDSAGLVTIDHGHLETRKCAGRIQALADLLNQQAIDGHVGISHTRWATHGRPTDENAHPHFDGSGRLALVHNGVIENYAALKADLLEKGHTFRSQTDTEVLAHLIGCLYDKAGGEHSKARLLDAVRGGLKQVIGTYGIALLHLDVPDLIVGARRGSPLCLGLGKGENFLASDPQAIVAYTREAIYLKDYDVVAVERDRFEISSLVGAVTGSYEVTKVDYTSEDIALGDFPHYMLKEIYEQPNSVRDALRGRLSTEDASARLGGLDMTPQELREIERVIITGCGTAYHAGLVGEYLLEAIAHLPAEVEIASEFRYRNMPIDKDTLVFAIS